ncbi:anti-sigma factor domain-containing protein, partial [Methanobrevibacter millerae]
MKEKSILYILLTLIILSVSIGIVSANENITDSADDFLAIENDFLIEEEAIEVTSENTFESNESEEILVYENQKNEDLLGISMDEDSILQAKVIPITGNHFAHVREAIDKAGNGDIIDLQGKTIFAVQNGNSSISTNKQLTFINGVFDAGNVSAIDINKRNFIENCNFENITFKNYNDVCMYPNFFINCTLRHVSFENFTLAVAGFVIRNSNLYDVNFTNCHSLEPENVTDYEYAAMAVTYNSVLDHCNFVNCTTNRHSGAICVAGETNNRVDIFNSNFINCSAGVGGAIYVHGNAGITENYHSNIINCTFIGNTATERGGAIGSSQNYLLVKNCTFEDNTAKRGAAYMLAGIDHGLDGISEGHYNIIEDCFFKNNTGTEEGGAVHITGNYNRIVNSTFYDNYATNGNGSAVYIHGNNSSIVNTEFYEHECSSGTVYIVGNNTLVDNSTFENNSASNSGAGIYVVGNNTLINNSVFNNNDVIMHGGALYSEGDNLRILNSNFTSNTAIASTDNMEQGLGGAIFISGDNSDIAYCYFENNVARNGSTIYNRGRNLSIEDDTFIENQAWSYLLTTISSEKRIYYDPEGIVTINVTHNGGDNIINAIYNDGEPDNIFFYNVTYESSVNQTQNTGNKIINPVKGVENSKNGTLIYQDSREDLQNITIIVIHLETGEVVINYTSQTGIYGNISVSKVGLPPGNYSVNVTHFEDGLYKYITNMTYFEILPVADLAVEKLVSDKNPDFGDEITWTILATNKGHNNVSDAYVIDKLPAGLIFNGADGDYNASSGVWNIGTLNVNQTVTLNIKTIVNITNTTILNVATINSSTHDPDYSNNVANNTTSANPLADLSVIKLVSDETCVIGDEITWTIVVTNNGPDMAVDAYAIDNIPKTLTYVRDDSNGRYNPSTGRWEIGNLSKGAKATLKITTKVNTGNTTIVNNVFVNSSTPDNNMSNNNASNSTKVLESNFKVEKITITPVVKLGDQAVFEIIVRNTGETKLNNVFVEEFSHNGLIYDSFIDNGFWTYSFVNGKNVWTLNNELGLNGVAYLFVYFNTTVRGNFTNVIVTGSDETDNKTTNNTTTVLTPDFTVKKITSTPSVKIGDQVTFEIVVRNTGETVLNNVFVEESSHDGLIYDSFVDNGLWTHSFVNGKNVWTLKGNLSLNAVVGFFVKFNTTKIGNFTNVVVAGSNETDNKTANNTTKVLQPGLDVSKITLTPVVNIGNQVTFEIVVRNTGETNLTNVFVEEFSHDGLTYDSFVDNGLWTHSVVNGKNVWTLNRELLLREVVNLFVKFNTTVKGNFTNVVVAGSDETDNKTSNNTTTVLVPDFTVEKITLTPSVKIGDQVTFEIVVRNTGETEL